MQILRNWHCYRYHFFSNTLSQFSKLVVMYFIRNILKLPGSQQSASDGKADGQLSLPQIRLPLHSLFVSQSPWFMSHCLVDVQHLQTLSLSMALQTLAEINKQYHRFEILISLDIFNPQIDHKMFLITQVMLSYI